MNAVNLYTKAMQQRVDLLIRGNINVNTYQLMIDQIIQDYFAEELFDNLKPQRNIDLIINSNL